jgi:hypothetical protein
VLISEVEHKVMLPYVQGTSKNIARILGKKQIITIFQLPHTTRSLLKLVKDHVDPHLHKGLYCIPCSCDLTYIGEIKSSFQFKIKEHKIAITHNQVNSSGLTSHSKKTKHHICIDDRKNLSNR